MFFRILYVLFVASQLLWGSYYLGGIITPRQLMVVIMFIVCVVEKSIKIDKYWWLYLVFLVCFGVSSFFTGYSDQFIRQLIGLFFASFVSYRSTIVMVEKYSAESTIIKTFIAIGLLDAVVTIGQFYNVPLANDFVSMMHFSGTDEWFTDYQRRVDILYGVTIPGIVGDVINGYLLSFVSIIALYNKENRIKIFNIILWVILMIGSFCVQERSGFFAGLILSLFMVFKSLSASNRNIKAIIIPLFVVLVAIGATYLFDALLASEMRYNIGGDMSNRSTIYAKSWDFILQHPWGGFFLLSDLGTYPHNLFLNALVFGGWLGGIMIFIILGMQFVKMLPLFIRPIKGHNDYLRLVIALAYTAFTGNSLLHNLSIVTGDATIWILWGCFIALSGRDTIHGEPV